MPNDSSKLVNSEALNMSSSRNITKPCKNCGAKLQGAYCHACGQSAATERIDRGFVLSDLKSGLLGLNAGLLYSVKQLLLRPGYAIRDYIDGKRIRYVSPFSLLILLASIQLILQYILNIDAYSAVNLEHESKAIQKLAALITDNFVYATLLTVPLFSIFSFLFLRKQKLNYFEHLTINSFAASQRIILHTIFMPLLLWVPHSVWKNGLLFVKVFFFSVIFYQLFKSIGKAKIILFSLLIYALSFVGLFVTLAIILLSLGGWES